MQSSQPHRARLVVSLALPLLLAWSVGCGRPNSVPIQQCGNGRIEGFEQCDGTHLGGADCVSLGALEGDLACDTGCAFDTSSCLFADECGNGIAEAGEDCDATDLGGDSCESLGYAAGALTCSATCLFDESGCS